MPRDVPAARRARRRGARILTLGVRCSRSSRRRGESVRETFHKTFGALERNASEARPSTIRTERARASRSGWSETRLPMATAGDQEECAGPPLGVGVNPGGGEPGGASSAERLRQVQPVRPRGQRIEAVKLDRTSAREGEFRCPSLLFQRGGSPHDQIRPHALKGADNALPDQARPGTHIDPGANGQELAALDLVVERRSAHAGPQEPPPGSHQTIRNEVEQLRAPLHVEAALV